MNIKEFAKNIAEQIQNKLGEEYQVATTEVLKTNNVKLTGIMIKKENSTIAPCIYANDFYDTYRDQNAEYMNDTADQIIQIYQENKEPHIQLSIWNDYDSIKDNIQGCLINTEKNTELLKDIPHRTIMDLSLVYLLKVYLVKPDSDSRNGLIRITNEILKCWSVNEQMLYDALMVNITKQIHMMPLESCIQQMDQDAPFQRTPAHVLTNINYQNGSVQLLNKIALKTTAQTLKSNLILLPSSIHEWLVVPQIDDDYESFAKMVRSINDSVVSDSEILSDHIYRYDAENEEISIVA